MSGELYQEGFEKLLAAMKAARPFVLRAATPETSYGGFYGGDPRNFSPDPECSTETERTAHAAACAEWDKGNEITIEADRCMWLARVTARAPPWVKMRVARVTMGLSSRMAITSTSASTSSPTNTGCLKERVCPR